MIEDDIRSLLILATPVPIIFANQNGPRPPKPYITLRVDTAPRSGILAGPVTETGEQAFNSHRDAVVELQCFGDGGFDALDTLAQRLHGPTMLAAAYAANMAIYQTDAVQNVPVLRDGSTYEPRAVLDIGVRYTLEQIEDVGLIQTVQGEMELQQGSTSTAEPFEAAYTP